MGAGRVAPTSCCSGGRAGLEPATRSQVESADLLLHALPVELSPLAYLNISKSHTSHRIIAPRKRQTMAKVPNDSR